ncbi:MAG: response regulator [Anaerolineae bacterium]|nr:response regulator [Anaerolineae bacterium]
MTQNTPKILIVDDKPQNLYTLTQLLGKLEAHVMEAASGAAALDLALQHDFCLAIVDVQMPEMDGYELVSLLRSNTVTANLPVIFVSAIFSDEYHHRRGYEAGAVDFMSKPFSPDILLSKVKIFLQIYHQRAELEQQRAKLEQANRALSKRTVELETGSRVGRHANSILDLEVLLPEVVLLMQTMFNYYFVGIWLAEEEKNALVLRAGHSFDGETPLKPGMKLPLDAPASIVVSAYRTKDHCLVSNASTDPRYLALKELPKTQSELALPLQIGTRVLGVLDLQCEHADAFDRDSWMALQMVANQIAIAIHNARQYDQEKGLRELEARRVQELAELNASKDRFFSIVAHDLRGPFNPLLGMAKLMTRLPDETPPTEFKSMAKSVYASARTVYELLDNLLAWSRLQRGRMEYEPERLDLAKIAERNIMLFTEVSTSKGIRLESTVGAGTCVHADPNILNAVLRNLISNALKFTPQGGRVVVTALPDTADPGLVAVNVSDTGVGIRPADQAKLFRLDVSHSTKGTAEEKGTGLGLIICQEMVKKNGGQIWIESDGVPGRGTRVKFTVPLLEAPAGGWEVKTQDVVTRAAEVEPEREILARLPASERAMVYDLARQGDLRAIEEWAAHMETQSEQYAPLADRVRQLARDFEEGKLLALFEPRVESQ